MLISGKCSKGKINLVAWKKYKNYSSQESLSDVTYLRSRSDSEKICRIPVKNYKKYLLNDALSQTPNKNPHRYRGDFIPSKSGQLSPVAIELQSSSVINRNRTISALKLPYSGHLSAPMSLRASSCRAYNHLTVLKTILVSIPSEVNLQFKSPKNTFMQKKLCYY